MGKRLSPSQMQALEDISKHGCPWYRVFGQSRHGGWHQVMRSLRRMDLARWDRGKWQLTARGKLALKSGTEPTP